MNDQTTERNNIRWIIEGKKMRKKKKKNSNKMNKWGGRNARGNAVDENLGID